MIIKVRPVWITKVNGVTCWESETQIGYFKSSNDTRPSSALWVDKNTIKPSSQLDLTEILQ